MPATVNGSFPGVVAGPVDDDYVSLYAADSDFLAPAGGAEVLMEAEELAAV